MSAKVGDEKWLFDGDDGKIEEAPADRLVVNEAFATRYEQKNRDMRIARLEAEVRGKSRCLIVVFSCRSHTGGSAGSEHRVRGRGGGRGGRAGDGTGGH